MEHQIGPHPYNYSGSGCDEFRCHLKMSFDADCISSVLSTSSFKISVKDQGFNFQWCSVA